jgi:hypothetical protein
MLRKNYKDPCVESTASNRSKTKREEAESDHSDSDSNTLASKEPLDFIVMLLETFVDHENINYVFEYLPGQDLFWILTNEHNLNLG